MLLRVGRIGKPHGLRGEVKVIPESDDPGRLSDIERLFVGKSVEDVRQYGVASLRFQPTKLGLAIILGLDGIVGPDSAEGLRGQFVYAHEDDLPSLSDGEWFIDDLAGMRVVDEENADVGVVKEVLDLPGNPVLVVQRPGLSDALIPAVRAFMTRIDVPSSTITIRTIEGLLE